MVLFVLLAAVGIAAAVGAARPASDTSRRRQAIRRARFVAAHPTQVTSSDIVLALVQAGTPADQARFVVRHGLHAGIKPFTLWLWLEQHGAHSLAVVVAADLTQSQLLAHLGEATSPDLGELGLFAAANGLETSVAPTRRGGRPPLRRGLAA